MNKSRDQTVKILGVRIHNVTMKDTLKRIEEFIASGRPHIIVTPNVDYIVKARSNIELRRILNSADLSIPDGMGVIYGSWIVGTPLIGTVGGRMLLSEASKIAAQKGYTLYLLGGRPGVANKASYELKRKYHGLRVVGTYHGYFGPEEELRVINDIKLKSPDILFVAFGTPKQEKWMARFVRELKTPVLIGVGSSFDRVSGYIKPPPKWMTKVGLEWLFRTMQEPRRLGKRYLIDDMKFFYLVWQQKRQMQENRKILKG